MNDQQSDDDQRRDKLLLRLLKTPPKSRDQLKADRGRVEVRKSDLPIRRAFNDATLSEDAPRFTDEYLRLGMPGWPLADNAIFTEAGSVSPQSPDAIGPPHDGDDRLRVGRHRELSGSGLPVVEPRSARRRLRSGQRRSDTENPQAAPSKGRKTRLDKTRTSTVP